MANTVKIKYRTTLVSFFDLLGFRELVRKESPERIASYLGLFRASGEIEELTATTFEARSFQFSDCIVRMMPLDSEANRGCPSGLLFSEVLTIVHACLEMANRGVPVRGGLTLGDAYFSGSTMFGPAMVRAYELESRLAVYPRVIIDPQLIDALGREPLLKKDTHSVSEEADYLRKLLRLDSDGLWFVDFLYAARNEVDDPEQYLELLSNNKRHLEEALADRKILDEVALKALWSARYHNRVLDQLITEHVYSDVDAFRIAIPLRLVAVLPE